MIEDFDLSGYTLFERQSKFYNGFFCCYCGRETELVDSTVIHQEYHGLIFYCKCCDAAVGTVFGDKALGCVGKKNAKRIKAILPQNIG